MQSAEDRETPRTVAMATLQRRGGTSADSGSMAAVIAGACQDLGAVLEPLIGQAGFNALTERAIHLTKREYPGLPAADGPTRDEHAAPLVLWLGQLGEKDLNAAGALMLSTLGGLLSTFIGEALTMRLLRKAWPESSGDPESKETVS